MSNGVVDYVTLLVGEERKKTLRSIITHFRPSYSIVEFCSDMVWAHILSRSEIWVVCVISVSPQLPVRMSCTLCVLFHVLCLLSSNHKESFQISCHDSSIGIGKRVKNIKYKNDDRGASLCNQVSRWYYALMHTRKQRKHRINAHPLLWIQIPWKKVLARSIELANFRKPASGQSDFVVGLFDHSREYLRPRNE